MTVAALVIDVAFVCCLSAYLLHRYGNWRKQHVLVTLATFIAWYFSFMIIFVLPIDVSNTFYRQCLQDNIPATAAPELVTTPADTNHSLQVLLPHLNVTNHTMYRRRQVEPAFPSPTPTAPGISDNDSSVTSAAGEHTGVTDRSTTPVDPEVVCKKPWSHVPPDILPTLWHVVYWTSQVLTWLILPMMQSYATAGDFTVLGKIKTSLISNAVYYGSYLLIFIVCLIYVAAKPNLHINGAQLKVLAVTASNTWGLFLLVLLLGYGLVEVPRSCWNASRRGHTLAHTHFKIAKLSVEKSEAEEALEDVMDDVKKAAETIKYNHHFRKHVETIVEKCPESVQTLVKQNRDDYEDYNNPTETPTEKSLVRLHVKVIKTTQNYRRTQVQWTALVEKAFELEDIAENEVSSRHSFQRTYGTYEGMFQSCHSPSIEWYWKCYLRPWGLRVACVILAIMSVMVVWSECLFFVKSPVLSLFAVFINLARENYDYFAIEFVSFMTISYLCVGAYFTIFRIRLLNYYYLASHHQTNEYSLIFAGMLLCRLTPPLCLNFLGLIHLDSHVTRQDNVVETDYTQIMGHMDVISFISDGFNIYFPIMIVLLCIATYFNLCGRCLHFLGFQQYIGEDDLTQELVDEGRELIRREHRRRQRQEEGDARRRDWQERYNEKGARSTTQRDGDMEAGNRKRTAAPKHKVAKSPDENDRTELLKQAEPIDYSGHVGSDPFLDDDPLTTGLNVSGPGRYQSQGSSSAANRPTSLSRFGSNTGRSAGGPPPKGIFDDI